MTICRIALIYNNKILKISPKLWKKLCSNVSIGAYMAGMISTIDDMFSTSAIGSNKSYWLNSFFIPKKCAALDEILSVFFGRLTHARKMNCQRIIFNTVLMFFPSFSNTSNFPTANSSVNDCLFNWKKTDYREKVVMLFWFIRVLFITSTFFFKYIWGSIERWVLRIEQKKPTTTKYCQKINAAKNVHTLSSRWHVHRWADRT